MLSVILHLLTLIHFVSLGGLALYGIHRIWLLFNLFKERRRNNEVNMQLLNHYPMVTVQLPLYNEKFVAARLIDAAAGIDWPREYIEIQVLDDSTDGTKQVVDERVRSWLQKGVDICVIRRDNRSGFKAGALENGLTRAAGEFIAVFDADFLPTTDFLHRTIPYFSNDRTGMVQARWGFLNDRNSWLTGIQAVFLGQHFSVEHFVRFRKGLFFNFNGTAGIWRKKAIETSGGWQSDTVTEDLDLSYRAQLAGWRFVYLDNLTVPSELPVKIKDFRTQQQRWAKGSIQTARKILPAMFCKNVPFNVKKEAAVHLLSNLCWLMGAAVTLTLYPAIISRTEIGPYQLLRVDLPLYVFASFAIFVYFLFYCSIYMKKVPLSVFLLLPVFTVGIAPGIALSVVKGIFCRGGVFCRTPKFGITGQESLPNMSSIYQRNSVPYIVMNILLLIYSILPVIFAFDRKTFLAIPFLCIFPMGFALVLFRDLIEIRK